MAITQHIPNLRERWGEADGTDKGLTGGCGAPRGAHSALVAQTLCLIWYCTL